MKILTTVKQFSYSVRMLGYDDVSGTLYSTDKNTAAEQAVLLFEQWNDISPDGTIKERIQFYSPKIQLVTRQ